jgi:putative hydrolase of the HAD superfamily
MQVTTVERQATAVGAVFLDIGGVLFAPDPDKIRAVLAERGLSCTVADVDRATYGPPRADLGMGADDDDGVVERHVAAFAGRLGISDSDLPRVLPGLIRVLTAEDWVLREPTATRQALRDLAATNVPIVVVTNAEGEAEAALADQHICQVGPGAGVEVVAIVDSAVVGVAKPDPMIFRIALSRVTAEAHEVVHVGDSFRNDVECAAAVGIEPVHFDPYGMCPHRAEHLHVTGLTDVVGLVHQRAATVG